MEGGRSSGNNATTAGTSTPPSPPARKVMVVADPTPQSAAALQYALSHALLENDELILIHVDNPNSWKNTFSTFLRRPSLSSSSTASMSEGGPNSNNNNNNSSGDVDFLDQMRRACEVAQPKIRVRTEKIEMDGKDKATAIIYRSQTLGAELIIIGQRRSLSSAILGHRLGGGSVKGAKIGIDTAEYLIENSPCTCVGVQKKGQNGGYLLNTKTHRNFWLLA